MFRWIFDPQLEEDVYLRFSESSNSSSDHEQSSESLRKDTESPEGGVHLQYSSDTEVKSNQGQKKKALLFTADGNKFLGEGIKLYGFGQIQVPRGQDCKLSIQPCIAKVQVGLSYK